MVDEFTHKYLLIRATGTFGLSTFVSFGIANKYIEKSCLHSSQTRKLTSTLNKFNNKKIYIKNTKTDLCKTQYKSAVH